MPGSSNGTVAVVSQWSGIANGDVVIGTGDMKHEQQIRAAARACPHGFNLVSLLDFFYDDLMYNCNVPYESEPR